MQFALICRDGKDALDRRLSARTEHLASVKGLKRLGNIIDGGAILDDDGCMVGSVVLCDFPTKEDLDAWLLTEPFVREGVWEQIEILKFQRVNWDPEHRQL